MEMSDIVCAGPGLQDKKCILSFRIGCWRGDVCSIVQRKEGIFVDETAYDRKKKKMKSKIYHHVRSSGLGASNRENIIYYIKDRYIPEMIRRSRDLGRMYTHI